MCLPPFGTSTSCSATPSSTQYNIQNFYGSPRSVRPLAAEDADPSAAPATRKPLQPVGLQTDFDLDHSHTAFVSESTHPSEPLTPGCGSNSYACAPSTWNQFMYVDNSRPLNYNNSYGKGTTHILDPYLSLATQYGWAN